MLSGGNLAHLWLLANVLARWLADVSIAIDASMNTRRNRFGAAAAGILGLPLFLLIGQAAFAEDVAVQNDARDPCKERIIEGYEPNTFGYTKQANDEGFTDFTISIKSQLFRDWICRNSGGRSRLYFTFTGRFGFPRR